MSAAAARSGGDDRGALLRRSKEKRTVRQEAAHLPVQQSLPGLPGVPQTIDPTRYTGTPADRLAALEEALDTATGNVGALVDTAKSWLDMQRGIVLREIRDTDLYKVRADTFEAYVSARWSMSRPRAYELIKAAPIQLAVSGKTDTAPPSTSHALALAPVYEEAGPEGAAKVHRQVQATAEETGKRATAQTVRKVARALGYGQPTEAAPVGDEDQDQAPVDPEAGRRALEVIDQDRETLRRIYDRLGEAGPLALAEDPGKTDALLRDVRQFGQRLAYRAGKLAERADES
ncbi:hypothetical protein ABZT02_45000 [Streptomyces sp. NPDC005402]|uniref:hypothetical protein n=1 Tax=Streptomyces sp. NPDC005402 TaxID=3155338 RepID=UPI0033A9C3CA